MAVAGHVSQKNVGPLFACTERARARRQAVATLSAKPTGFTKNQGLGFDTNNDTKQDVFEERAAEVIQRRRAGWEVQSLHQRWQKSALGSQDRKSPPARSIPIAP
jgi:hypothetical protein